MQFYTYLYLRKDGSPYYVGKGSNGRAYASSSHKLPRQQDGTIDRARIFIQHWFDEAAAFEMEKWYIQFFGRKNNGTGILRNLTDGGDGGLLGFHPIRSAEYREKQKIAQTGKTLSPEHKAKFCATGRHQSPESIEKSAAKRRGRIVSKETRENISASLTGRKLSQEQREAIGNAHRSIPLSPEHRLKISEGNKGKVMSPESKERMRVAQSNRSVETRAKMSAAAKGYKRRLGAVLSEETKAKISAAHKGKTLSPEHIENLRVKNSMRTRNEKGQYDGTKTVD